MEVFEAIKALLLLDAVLLGAFVAAIFLVFSLNQVLGFTLCQVCVAVSAVWVLNVFTRVLPAWVTIFLLGQSVAGGASLLRDVVAGRLGFNDRPEKQRRLLKQLTYFGAIVAGTLGAIGILALAYPDLVATL